MQPSASQCPQCGAIIEPAGSLCVNCGAMYHVDGERVILTGQVCFSCGHQTEGSPKSCPACGTPYTVECPACGREFESGAGACPDCGHDLRFEVHQRVDRERGAEHAIRSESATGVLVRILAVVGVMAVLFLLVDRIDWSGPDAFVGLVMIMGLLSLTVVYVLYSPFFGRSGRRKPRRPRRSGRFAEVYRTLNLARARHLKSLLDAEGIPAFLYNENATTLDPFDVFTGIRVVVPSDRLTEVRELMPAFGFETDLAEEHE